MFYVFSVDLGGITNMTDTLRTKLEQIITYHNIDTMSLNQTIDQIEGAFREEGYCATEEKLGSVMYSLGKGKPMSLEVDDSVETHNLMEGKEWYDRFIDNFSKFRLEDPDHRVTIKDITLLINSVIDSAKKAAGIEDNDPNL